MRRDVAALGLRRMRCVAGHVEHLVAQRVVGYDELCNLVAGLCITGVGTLDDFEANPTVTLTPLAAPEPGVAWLLLITASSLAWGRRRP